MRTSTPIDPRFNEIYGAASTKGNLAKCLGMTGAIVLALGTTSARAATLTNGALNVVIRDDNGAISSVVFGGSDFYNPGIPIADYGFQNGSDTTTFIRNTTDGETQQPVSVASNNNSVMVTGTYTGGGANVGFTRTYSLVEGLDVLRITTQFFNNAASNIALQYFDTFDPDQGIDLGNGFGTFNDVFSLPTPNGTARVGQATETDGLTVVMGSLDPNATIGQDLGLGIDNGNELNQFFNNPIDGNGNFSDIGTHVGGIMVLLAAGESRTFVYDQAYGMSAAAAQEQFIKANTTSVPEPATVLGLFGVGLLGAISRLKRNVTPKD